jgi:predicted metal-binding membrane protein
VIERVLRHDRWVVIAGVVAVAGLAWLDVWRRARGVMDMAMPEMEPWSPTEFGAILAMWLVMMIAMMLPSAAPMLLLFAGTQRGRAPTAPPTAVVAFGTGYLLVWGGFSVAAAALQAFLQQSMLLSSDLAITGGWLGVAILLLAGIYQLTPLKNACLLRCQSPLGFLLSRWRDGLGGALAMGVHHGAYCLGCCWALMTLLFVGGVMNLVWVAVLAVFVLAEKVLARGVWLSRVSGFVLIAWAVWLATQGAVRTPG